MSAEGYATKRLAVEAEDSRAAYYEIGLDPSAECRVLVLTRSGEPVAGAEVHCERLPDAGEWGPWAATAERRPQGVTDPDGVAVLLVATATEAHVVGPFGALGAGTVSPGEQTTITLGTSGAQLLLEDESGGNPPELAASLRHTPPNSTKTTRYRLTIDPEEPPVVLSEGRWTVTLQDENASFAELAMDGEPVILGDRSQEFSVEIGPEDELVSVVVRSGVPLQLVDAGTGQAIAGPFVYTQRFLFEDGVWHDGISRAGRAAGSGLAHVVDLSRQPFPFQFSMVCPGYAPSVITSSDIHGSSPQPLTVPLSKCAERDLTLRFSNGDPYSGYVKVVAFGSEGDRLRLFSGFVTRGGKVSGILVPRDHRLEIEDHTSSPVARSVIARVSADRITGPSETVVLEADFGMVRIEDVPPGAPLPAVIDAMGFAHPWRLEWAEDGRRRATTSALLAGSYHVGPVVEALRASGTDRSWVSSGRMSPTAVEVGPDSMTVLPWNGAWEEGSGVSGTLEVCAASRPDILAVPVYRWELQDPISVGPSAERIDVDGTGLYELPPGTLPEMLLVCSKDHGGNIVPLGAVAPGEDGLVRSCDLRLWWVGADPGRMVRVQLEVSTDHLPERVSLATRRLESSWGLAKPLTLVGLPAGPTRVQVKDGASVLAEEQVLLTCGVETELFLE